MTLIYHYCSYEAFDSILKNRTLRFSDIRKSNDPMEIDFLFEEYKDWNKRKNNNQNNAQRNNSNLEIFKESQLKGDIFLVSCFTRNYDTLAMWNRYARKGVAIGFDESKLLDSFEKVKHGIPEKMIKDNIPSSSDAIVVRDVQYFSDGEIDDYFDSQNLNGYDDFIELYRKSPFIKSDVFKDEEEVRAVYWHTSNTNMHLNYLSLTDAHGFHKGNIPFKSVSDSAYQHKMVVDIPFDVESIKSITIGPDSKITEKDIEEILFVNGLAGDIEIKRAKGLYR